MKDEAKGKKEEYKRSKQREIGRRKGRESESWNKNTETMIICMRVASPN